MKKQFSKSGDLERDASSWSVIDLALVAVRIAEEANAGPWCHRTPTGYAAWFTAAAMVTARLRALDLVTAADLVAQKIDGTPTDHACSSPRSEQIRFARTILSSGPSTASAGARAWLVHPGTATWQ